MSFDRSYLERLAQMEAPEDDHRLSYAQREEQVADYSSLRVCARELLANPKNEFRIAGLPWLLKKLKIEVGVAN